MATYSDVLRGKSRASGLRKRGETFRGLANDAGSFVTQPGQVQQMGGMAAPTPQSVNWGSIIQRGLGNYMAGKADKQADEAERQATELNQQFMRDAIGEDPEAQRLLQMAQAGVPGADKALADKVAPKRQPLATFTQFVSQNPDLDDESLAALGAEVGISPQLAIGIGKAAKAGTLRTEKLGLEKEQRTMEGNLLRDENKAILRQQYAPPPRGVAAGTGLTPGQKSIQARMQNEADKELMALGQSGGKFQDLMSTIDRDEIFGKENKVSQFLAESPNRLLAAVGRSNLSEGSLMLKEYMNSKVLERMKALGGNDSNEELRTISASLPDAMNNKEAAMAMLTRLHEWEETNRLAIKLRRDDIQSGAWFNKQPSRDDYYQMAKAQRASGQQGFPQPAQAAPLSGIPTEQVNGIEGLLDELGLQ